MRASMFQILELVVTFLESRVVYESLRARRHGRRSMLKRVGSIMAAGKLGRKTITDREAIEVDVFGGDGWHFVRMVMAGWVVDR